MAGYSCLYFLNQSLYKQYEEFILHNAESFELFYHKELFQKSITDKKFLFQCNEKFAKSYTDFEMGEIRFVINFSPTWEVISFWGETLKSEQVISNLQQKCSNLFNTKRFSVLWGSGDLVFQLIHPYSQFRYSIVGINSLEFWHKRSEFFLLSLLVGILFGLFYFLSLGAFSWLRKKPSLYGKKILSTTQVPPSVKNSLQSIKKKLIIREFSAIQKDTEGMQKYQSEIFLYKSLSHIPKEIADDTKSYCQHVSRILCELLFPEKHWILQIFLPNDEQKNLLQCVLSSQKNSCLKNEISLQSGEEGRLLQALSPYKHPTSIYTTMSGQISKEKKMAIRITNIKKAPLDERTNYLFIQSTLHCAKILSKSIGKKLQGEQLLLEQKEKTLPELDSNQRPSG